MIGAYRQAIRKAHRPTLVIGYALLAIALVALIIYLRGAEKPWEDGVEARLAEGRNVKVVHHIITGLWYGSWINLVLCVMIAFAMPFLAQPLVGFKRLKTGVSPKSRLAFLITCLLATTLAVFMLLPRMSKSLWGDEEYTLRRSVIGEYERDANDVPKLGELKWTDTFWGYKKPNNHILNSVLTRLSHETLYKADDTPGRFYFSEPILRLPAFLAALGGLIATGYALACLGNIRAGIVAMFILAMHPWFLRYGTETRGYAFVFLFAALSIVFLLKAVRRGRWSYWLAYALCELLLFLAYPGSLYLLVSMNLSGTLLVFLTPGGWTNKRVQLGRFLTANVISGMLVIQAMAPCYLQLKAYLAKSEGQHFEDWSWVLDNLSYLASGMPWNEWLPGSDLCNALVQRPILGSVFLLVTASAFIAGCIRLFRHSEQSRALLCLFILQWPLLIVISHFQNNLLYHWYSLPILVPTVMIIALGVEWLAHLPLLEGTKRFSAVGAVAFIGLFSIVASPQLSDLRNHSIEPLQESVRFTREVTNPNNPRIDETITVGFHQATRGYDPTMYFIRQSDSPDKFANLLKKSQTEGKPLFVNLAMLAAARIGHPEIMKIVDDPTQFKLEKKFPGMAENTTRYIFRYIGKGERN